MQPPLRKSAPGPPNISDAHVSCTAPATRNACLQILFKCPTPATAFETVTKPSRFAHFWQGAQSLAPATQNGIWTSKSAPSRQFFARFDFDMYFTPQRRTLFRHVDCQKCSENGVHFDFEMRFAPQRHTLFRHVDCQKCSKNGVLCTFWLRHVLRATTACNCSSLIWPDGSAPAALASLLFDPPEHKSLEKHSDSRLVYLFAFSRTCVFFLWLFSDLLASSLLFSDSSHLCFFICPYCRKLYVHRCKYKCLFSKIFYYVFAGAQPLD